jgi:acetamidase/formamidase
MRHYHHIAATDASVHWGYFSKLLEPVLMLRSGDFATIETLTHQAMRDAFRKTRRFLMTTQRLTEDEAITLMSVGIDFGITQVVDGNWGVHAIVKKGLFAGRNASALG